MPRDIAIVSYSFRFPELDTDQAFWNLLIAKGTTVTAKPINRPTTLPTVGSFFKDPDIFDYAFFSLSAQEAMLMDRQQRLLLELAWHCYEASHLSLQTLQKNSTGVFIGSMLLNQEIGADVEQGANRYLATGISESILSNRISHFLKLNGPSITINTACSSSLVALQAAKDALLTKSCEYAFVGASNMLDSDLRFRSYKEMGILSETIETHAFSSKSTGFVPGEGGVVLLITTYEKAIEDGLHIHGIIKGCAVTHTGSFCPKGLTSPSVSAQANCLSKALQNAELQPYDIEYIECHGTGTLVGDPIELAALHQIYGHTPQSPNHIYPIGSVKNNIGHLEACAGLASVIKGLLMFRYNMLPPNTPTEKTNPLFDLISNRFDILKSPKPYDKKPGKQRVIAISSFGFGGTNAHLLLGENTLHPLQQQEPTNTHCYPFVLSANGAGVLEKLKQKWLLFLSKTSLLPADLQCISSQLIVQNQSFPNRYAITFDSQSDLAKKLVQNASLQCTPNKKVAIHLDRSATIKNHHDFASYLADLKKFSEIYTPVLWIAEHKIDAGVLFCLLNKNCDDLLTQTVWQNIENREFDFQALKSPCLIVLRYNKKLIAFKDIPHDYVKTLKEQFLKEASLFKTEILDNNDTAALLQNKRFYAVNEQWKKALQHHKNTEALEIFALFCSYFTVIEYWSLNPDRESYPALSQIHFLIEAEFITQHDCIAWLEDDVDFTNKLLKASAFNHSACNHKSLRSIFTDTTRIILDSAVEEIKNIPLEPLPSTPGDYLDLWQKGCNISLELLYPPALHNKIPLPLYPFQKTSVAKQPIIQDNSVSRFIKKTLSESLKIPLETISETTQFDELGLNSLTIMQITEDLSRTFGPQPATLLYEYTTLLELQSYFEKLPSKQERIEDVKPTNESIAIIGLSAKLPGGSTVDEFWDMLSQGRSAITTIPKDRWNTKDFFSKQPQPGTSYTFFGGILDDIKRFDCLFFGISPREARQMDPQERLFLECSWNAIEDAGYKISAINTRKIGVFAGVTNGLYGWNDPDLWQKQVHSNVSSAYWSVANRVSYCLNVTGPSLAVDTACSSSLTAIHLAIQSLQQKECDYALAGASSLLIHPRQYVELCDLKMLSPSPTLKSFGKDADGFVYGEGVGVVLLKRLSDAIKDNDPIYAILCGSSIGATGKTSGYTVPSPTAQGYVVQEAIKKAGIEPSQISYIEAHGTGTSLGDPIEIRGLIKVFGHNPKPCLIGSVKSNIGHLEASAGIASLIKVVAQLQHRAIAASLHCQELNPKIDLEGSSLVISKTLQPWGDNQEETLYAGISSFGAGGSNAHIVVSSAPLTTKNANQQNSQEILPILLSAKDTSALLQKAKDLLEYVRSNPTISIRDISFTLATGRERFSSIWVCNANSLEMLKTELLEYIHNNKPSETHYTLPSYENCQRLHLPTYPFQGMPYWIAPKYSQNERKEQIMNNSISPFTPVKSEVLDDSTIYHFSISVNEFYFKDHILNGKYILPGVAHLELARAAYTVATPVHFSRVTWAQPIVSFDNQELEIQIHITKKSDTRVSYKIMGLNGTILHSQGELSTELTQTVSTAFSSDEHRKYTRHLKKQDFYAVLANLGWQHGPSLQTIDALYATPQKSDEALAYIRLEEMPGISQLGQIYPTFLHPSIMDGILQSVISPHILNLLPDEKPALPFGFDALNIHKNIPLQGWVKIVRTTPEQNVVQSHDLRFYDDDNTLILELIGFKSRKEKPEKKERPLQHIQLYRQTWQQIEHVANDKPQTIILVGANAQQQKQYSNSFAMDRHSTFEQWCHYFTNNPLPHAILYFIRDETPSNTFEQVFSFTKAAIHSRVKALQIVAIGSSHTKQTAQAGMLVGFGKTLSREHPHYSLQVLLVNAPHTAIIFWPPKSHSTAYTVIDGTLHEQKYCQEAWRADKTLLKKQGCYIITGGNGGIGKELAEHLVSKYQASVVIASRRPVASTTQKTNTTCDISSFEDTKMLLDFAHKKFGKIDGIFHAAGTLHDSLIYNKTIETAAKVLSPKINGLINIHESLIELNLYKDLDFLVSFSSISALLGNTGQSDYAAANAYMDSYTQYIQSTITQYNTQVLSINWPYWKTGGMQVSSEIEKAMQEKWGVSGLETNDGLLALEQLLQGKSAFTSVLVAPNVSAAFAKNLALIEEPTPIPELPTTKTIASAEKNKTVEVIKEIVKEIQELDVSLINPFTALSDYGFDSITYTTLSNKLNEAFSLDTTPAFFFEVSTINDIADFIIPKEPEKQINAIQVAEPTSYDDGIAIVGLSGKLPGAETLDEFWQNMIAGKEVISEIPQDRWKWQDYFGDPATGNKTNVKYGGFISDYDKFDAEFFGINGREATFMDPQHRLFLEHSWSCIEDAGYTPDRLSQGKTGLFVGVSTHDYLTMLSQHPEIDVYTSTGSVHCLLPNRVSYYLNLTGPSESIDTACSSSLVALHRAVASLQSGECSFALAGGINALLHPIFYISFSKAGMLSEDGKCKTFDKNADGYVRGEGVGVVLLKRLKDAVRDNDHIYAIIRGSSVNHGGKTNTLTSPSPKSQSLLIQDALQRAKVDPRSISYIEAHGTGTSLGDPIEVNALKAAFTEATKNYPSPSKNSLPAAYCAIGTVKTHIGHLEPAAGIAGVIKVLLALKHEVLPKALNFSSLNPYINLDNSPFYIQHKETPWPRVTEPRRAGVSSFGFGGVNSHLILEEHVGSKPSNHAPGRNLLITLSAKTTTALGTKIDDLLQWIDQNNSQFCLADLSFTTNVGRLPMAYRTAFVVKDIEELKTKLNNLKQSPTSIQHVTDNKGQFLSPKKYSDNSHCLKTLQEAFLSGYQILWEDFYEGALLTRISLPTYPFEKKRYWLTPQPIQKPPLPQNPELRISLHPYQSLIASHVVNGLKMLPGIAVVSIVKQHVPLLSQGYTISSIVWFHSISNESANELIIKSSGTHIDLLSSDGATVLCELELVKETAPEDIEIDLETIEETLISSQEQYEIYKDFEKKNIIYGPALKLLSNVQWNKSCCLATMSSKIASDELILEAGLQSLHVFSLDQQLPFKVGTLSTNGPLQKAHYSYAVAEPEGYKLYFLSRSSKIIATLDSIVLKNKEMPASGLFAPYWAPALPFTVHNADAIKDLEALIFSSSEYHPIIATIKAAHPSATHIAIDSSYSAHQGAIDMAFEGKNISRIIIVLPSTSYKDAELRNALFGFSTLIQKILHSNPSLSSTPLQILLLSSNSLAIDTAEKPYSDATVIQAFASVIAKEFEKCGVCCIDVPDTVTRFTLNTIPYFHSGIKTYGYRNHLFYEKKWHEFSWRDTACGFKKEGVYVLIGGAGGLGTSLANYLVEQYNASVFLIGRSSKTMLPKESIAHTNRVTYIQADCSNKESLSMAIDTIKTHKKRINGVIHTTLHLHDHPIAGITHDIINSVCMSKIDGTIHSLDCFAEEPLDFFLIFSSVNSFLPQPGQAPYTAACSFQDSCIHREYSCPIKVINWGFWGDLGAVAKPEYKDRFFTQGLHSINPKQAWKDVDLFIKSDLLQMAYIPATKEYYKNAEIFVVGQ